MMFTRYVDKDTLMTFMRAGKQGMLWFAQFPFPNSRPVKIIITKRKQKKTERQKEGMTDAEATRWALDHIS